MTPDLINGLFELVGGLLLAINVRRLWIDREIAGISPWPVAFFTSWGFWNLFFYPHLACWWSFAGGLLVVAANAAWLVLLATLAIKDASTALPDKIKTSVSGTFNTSALFGFGARNEAERTAKATEQTARNTQRLLDRADFAGSTFV